MPGWTSGPNEMTTGGRNQIKLSNALLLHDGMVLAVFVILMAFPCCSDVLSLLKLSMTELAFEPVPEWVRMPCRRPILRGFGCREGVKAGWGVSEARKPLWPA
jgi:hypothetical protein